MGGRRDPDVWSQLMSDAFTEWAFHAAEANARAAAAEARVAAIETQVAELLVRLNQRLVEQVEGAVLGWARGSGTVPPQAHVVERPAETCSCCETSLVGRLGV